MNILPISADSLGIRSFCVLVDFNKVKILIDPSAALAPRRYGLKPTDLEKNALNFYLNKIKEISKICNLIVVTHYHWDHVIHYKKQEFYEIYKNKIVILKDYKEMHIRAKIRGKKVEEKIKEYAKEIYFYSDKSFEFENVYIELKNFWHTIENSKVGKVNVVYLENEKSIIYFSDNCLFDSLQYAIEKNPDFAILDGFPTYQVGKIYEENQFLKFKENLKKFIEKTKVKEIILDHHLVRDLNYQQKILDLIEFSISHGVKIFTCAEYLGLRNLLLEALRKFIYSGWRTNLNEYFEKYQNKIFEKIKL